MTIILYSNSIQVKDLYGLTKVDKSDLFSRFISKLTITYKNVLKLQIVINYSLRMQNFEGLKNLQTES